MSRTITITVTNHCSETLSYVPGSAKSDEGPAAQPLNNQQSVAPGGTIAFSATNTALVNGGNKGTFTLANSDKSRSFVIFYTHPQLGGETYVQVQNTSTAATGSSVTWLVEMRNLPPFGIASRALIVRLTSTCSSIPASA